MVSLNRTHFKGVNDIQPNGLAYHQDGQRL